MAATYRVVCKECGSGDVAARIAVTSHYQVAVNENFQWYAGPVILDGNDAIEPSDWIVYCSDCHAESADITAVCSLLDQRGLAVPWGKP